MPIDKTAIITLPPKSRNPAILEKQRRAEKAERLAKLRRETMGKFKLPSVHQVVAALPILATNATAVVFQLAWAHNALASWGQTGAILYSCTVESIALSISYHAYRAEIENLRAGGLRLMSVLFGALIGVLNGSHEVHHNLALAAVAFGTSAMSPWLWHMYSRQASAVILARNGLMDYHSIRLGPDRWLFHPIRSFQIKRECSWSGERVLSKAIKAHDARVAEKSAQRAADLAMRNIDGELETL